MAGVEHFPHPDEQPLPGAVNERTASRATYRTAKPMRLSTTMSCDSIISSNPWTLRNADEFKNL